MIKVKLIHEGAKVPTRAHATDARLDLYACAEGGFVIAPMCGVVVPSGIAMSIPDGYVARVLPRSGLAIRGGIHIMAGVIDSSYRGEVKVAMFNLGGEVFRGNHGDKIAQLVIQKIELWNPVVVDELDETDRGVNGFGSSGV